MAPLPLDFSGSASGFCRCSTDRAIHLFRHTKGAILVPCSNYLMNALDTVLAWDLPDASFGSALNAQANLLAGGDSEQSDAFPEQL